MLSEDDLLVLLLAAPFLAPVLIGVVVGSWEGGREELVDKGYLVSGDEAIWAVPGWDGVGIGAVHIVILACLLLVVMVVGSLIVQRRRRKKIDIEGWGT